FGVAAALARFSLIETAEVGREHQVVHKAGFDQRHYHRNLLHVAGASLSVEPYERSAPADFFVDRHLGVDHTAEMADDDTVRFDPVVFENVELFERRFAGNSGVGEDRKIGGEVGFGHSAEDFAFRSGHPVPGTDLPKDADGVLVDLFNERLRDLLFA